MRNCPHCHKPIDDPDTVQCPHCHWFVERPHESDRQRERWRRKWEQREKEPERSKETAPANTSQTPTSSALKKPLLVMLGVLYPFAWLTVVAAILWGVTRPNAIVTDDMLAIIVGAALIIFLAHILKD